MPNTTPLPLEARAVFAFQELLMVMEGRGPAGWLSDSDVDNALDNWSTGACPPDGGECHCDWGRLYIEVQAALDATFPSAEG